MKSTAAALTAAALAALALASGASSQSDAAPSAIVDNWSRTVTTADAKRRGNVATGAWRFEVKGSGAMSLFHSTSRKPVVTGKLTTGPSGTLKMINLRVTGGGVCTAQATYRWRVSGGRLVLTTTADKCPGRAAVLVGTWRRS